MGENIENQFAAVQYLDLDNFFEFADLPGRQVVVENDHISFFGMDFLGEHFGLAGADIGSGIDTADFLDKLVHNNRTGTFSQGRQLLQDILTINTLLLSVSQDSTD